MKIDSPFATSRFEYESRHIYYLPKDLFAELEDAKPSFVVGSRGTGKTTLLKALNWDERINNHTLRKQLDGSPFKNRCIGVYVKAPEYQLEEFDLWLDKESDSTYGTVLGFIFDVIWVELLATAMAHLSAHSILNIKPENEHASVGQIADKFEEILKAYLPRTAPFTLRHLSKACAQVNAEWQRLAKARPDALSLIGRLPIGQAGSFGRAVGKLLCQLCDISTAGKKGWHFKVCIDESESLRPRQQKVINTLVRLAEWPVFPIVSFVSLPEDYTNTLIHGLTLQKADRHLKILDDMTDTQFRDLAEGVANVRLRHYLKTRDTTLKLDRLLGRWNVNKLLETRLRASANQSANALLQKAERLSQHAFFADAEVKESPGAERPTLPIYQAYLIDRLGIRIPSSDDPHWRQRAQDSADLRKRIVAAYLSICLDVGMDVQYASAEVVLQLSDKCTRDFLAQLEMIYRAMNCSVERFVSLEIPYNAQTKPVKDASFEKSNSLVKFGVRAPTDAGRLIDGLARITMIVQTSGRNLQHLRSSERGIFELDAGEAATRGFSSSAKLIIDAAEAGFLRLFASEGKMLRFRVHTSLAANYGFSYRGAYYPVRLAWTDVTRLLEAADADAHDRAVSEIGKRLAGQESDDMPLFNNLF